MPKGGRRPGAGRKPGAAWKPAQKALRAAVRERVLSVVEAGADPVSFLCNVVKNDAIDLPTRMQAAGIVLPYVAPRQSIAVVAHASAGASPMELLAVLEDRLARLSAPPPTIDMAPDPAPAEAA